MDAVLHPTTTQTLPFVWFPVVATTAAAMVALVLGRRGLAGWADRHQRPAADAATSVQEVAAAAVAEDDGDYLVMRAAYELCRLLDLRDCRWAAHRSGTAVADGVPAAVLHDDAAVTFGPFRWRTEVHGLPLRGVERPLTAHGRVFGSLVLVPRSTAPVAPVRLRAAVVVCDILALGLDHHGASMVPAPGSQP
jgi:hypothetical protein